MIHEPSHFFVLACVLGVERGGTRKYLVLTRIESTEQDLCSAFVLFSRGFRSRFNLASPHLNPLSTSPRLTQKRDDTS